MAGTASAQAASSQWHRLRVPPDKISIQLYTLRSILENDLEGTLEALADMGYRKVELAGTYGRSAEEFRGILDSYCLYASSSHVGIDGDLDQVIADAHTLGHRFVVVPYVNLPTVPEWQAFADRLEQAGRTLRKAGLRLGYHNHAHEFAEIDGVRPYDVITRRTTRRNVHLEVDLYWVVTGEVDPVRLYWSNYPRVRQYHVKDRAPDGGFANLGEGTIDFRRIFRATWHHGVDEYIVEHDQPTDPLHTAKVGYDYLHNVRF